MNQEYTTKKLQSEDFTEIYVWQDTPETHHPSHTHPDLTAHIILEGEMELTVAGKKHLLQAGDRLDVPAGVVHSAKIGPSGCKMIIGSR